jgi:hypothetical protein
MSRLLFLVLSLAMTAAANAGSLHRCDAKIQSCQHVAQQNICTCTTLEGKTCSGPCIGTWPRGCMCKVR